MTEHTCACGDRHEYVPQSRPATQRFICPFYPHHRLDENLHCIDCAATIEYLSKAP